MGTISFLKRTISTSGSIPSSQSLPAASLRILRPGLQICHRHRLRTKRQRSARCSAAFLSHHRANCATPFRIEKLRFENSRDVRGTRKFGREIDKRRGNRSDKFRRDLWRKNLCRREFGRQHPKLRSAACRQAQNLVRDGKSADRQTYLTVLAGSIQTCNVEFSTVQ